MTIDKKHLHDLRKSYKDILKNWHETPNQMQYHFAELIQNSWPAAKYVARNLPYASEAMVICPPYSALNSAPNQQHRIDYGTTSFEGSSAEPHVDKDGKVIGMNVLLHEPRLKRLVRSMQARNYKFNIPLEQYSQAILDTVAVNGLSLVMEDNGELARAYIRPSVGPAVGSWGVCFKPDHFIEASVLAFRWGKYFQDTDRIYNKFGLRTVITGLKRTFPISGKHASNYGAAAAEATAVRDLGFDELIYLAPYAMVNHELHYGVSDITKLIHHGVLADGPAEEIVGVWKDNETLIYPPMRTNRLGGTVLDYVVQHLAPAIGIKVLEKDITVKDIMDGNIVGMAFVGNAVRVTPVGSIDLALPRDDREGTVVESLAAFGIHPLVAKIADQFMAEITGRKKPSHPSLLTPVDLTWGKEFRDYLDEYWAKIFKTYSPWLATGQKAMGVAKGEKR